MLCFVGFYCVLCFSRVKVCFFFFLQQCDDALSPQIRTEANEVDGNQSGTNYMRGKLGSQKH